jgi:hypothetical protein
MRAAPIDADALSLPLVSEGRIGHDAFDPPSFVARMELVDAVAQ